MALDNIPPWSWEELLGGFLSLDQFAGRSFNIAFLIDGLDEFDGDHDRLVGLIKQLHRKTGVKVCVSSRPWNVFRDAFRSSPQLRMERLTEQDMESCVQGMFGGSVAFMELDNAYPDEARELLTGIVGKAEGVFLWVTIVTSSFLSGLADGDDLKVLTAILDQLPSDLSGLYDNIWSRMDSSYRGDRSRILRLFQAYTTMPIFWEEGRFFPESGIPAGTLWLADGGSPRDPVFIEQTLTRRLNSRTRDLLEILPTGNVEYLHRAARDWVQTVWPQIVETTPEGFDPYRGLLLMKLHEMSLPHWPSLGVDYPKITFQVTLWRWILKLYITPRDSPRVIKTMILSSVYWMRYPSVPRTPSRKRNIVIAPRQSAYSLRREDR